MEAAFEELSEDVKQQHAAQRQQKITDQMAKVLEAVDLDKYMEGKSFRCSQQACPFGQPCHCHAHLKRLLVWHHAGAPLEEAVRPGHDLPEKVLRALKDDERP